MSVAPVMCRFATIYAIILFCCAFGFLYKSVTYAKKIRIARFRHVTIVPYRLGKICVNRAKPYIRGNTSMTRTDECRKESVPNGYRS